MEFLNQDHIIVTKPLTSNGRDLLIVDGQVQYKTIFAPLDAKKHFDKRNEILPASLKLNIQVVKVARPQVKNVMEEAIKAAGKQKQQKQTAVEAEQETEQPAPVLNF